MSEIHELRDAIHRLHKAKAKHLQSVPVVERFQGQIVWDGIVQVFKHPKANRIYAWAHLTDDPKQPKRYVTVLHIPPLVSSETAVRAVIVQESKDRDRNKEN